VPQCGAQVSVKTLTRTWGTKLTPRLITKVGYEYSLVVLALSDFASDESTDDMPTDSYLSTS